MTTEEAMPHTSAPETPQDSTPAAENKCKKNGKLLLDFSPMLIQTCVGFGLVKGEGVYISTGVVVGVSIVALIVDYIHCKHRWEAGLQAVFPKLFPVVFLVAFAIILVLLCTGALTTEEVIQWNAAIVVGGLFLASLTSQLIGKPWIRAVAMERMPPEQVQRIATGIGAAVFDSMMSALTILWTCTLGVMALCSVGVAIWKVYGGGGAAAQATGAVALTLVAVLTATVVQPRVIERSKQRTLERLIPGYDPETSPQAADPFASGEQLREQPGMSPQAADPLPAGGRDAV